MTMTTYDIYAYIYDIYTHTCRWYVRSGRSDDDIDRADERYCGKFEGKPRPQQSLSPLQETQAQFEDAGNLSPRPIDGECTLPSKASRQGNLQGMRLQSWYSVSQKKEVPAFRWPLTKSVRIAGDQIWLEEYISWLSCTWQTVASPTSSNVLGPESP